MRTRGSLAAFIWLYSAAAAGSAVSAARASGPASLRFDAPCAGTGFDQGTYPLSINSSGSIAGYYLDAGLLYHGFLRVSDGAITTFDVPGAGTGAHQGTTPMSINRYGTITGYYYSVAAGTGIGFIRSPGGDFTTFAAPTEPSAPLFPNSINAAGAVVGTQVFGNSLGFVRAPNGALTTLEILRAWSINDSGTIAGTCEGGVCVRSSTCGLTKFQVPTAQSVAIPMVR
jgi:hypothetical protein